MRIGILTGGGDCPGLNAVIRSIAKPAMSYFGATVIGIEDGFEGFVEGRDDGRVAFELLQRFEAAVAGVAEDRRRRTKGRGVAHR